MRPWFQKGAGRSERARCAHGDIGPHVHFESLNPLGRVIENNHVPLLSDVPGTP